MKNVLLTGGAGFIGSHLVDRLLADGKHLVTVVDDFNDFYSPLTKRRNIAHHRTNSNFKLVEANIADVGAMTELVANSNFDCIVHLAARAGVRPSLENPLAYQETNVRGTYVLLEAARKGGVQQFVFGSSSSVYGENSKVPFSEDDPLTGPISPYAATKIAGEAACYTYSHLYGMRVLCLRFFTVYGPRQRPDLAIHKFARLITEGKPIPFFGDGTTRRDYTYIDDIISGVVSATDYHASNYEVMNLGESETVTLSRLVELLELALGKPAVIDRQPSQPGDVPITYANIEKAKSLLGYKPSTGIEAGIDKFIDWYRTVDRGR
jgi:UDP-glucuronate 4-epimerase